LVLDGSAALAFVLRDERVTAGARAVRAALEEAERILVPGHWWLEVVNGIVVAERRKRLTAAAGMEIIKIFRELDVEVDAEPAADVVERVASLAREKNLSAYDAAYLELAVRNGVALASQDKALLGAAASFGVKTLG